MDNLNDLLEEHISRKDRRFVAFGIGTCRFKGHTERDNFPDPVALAINSLQEWTTVSLFINKSIDESTATRTLKSLETDIDKWLTRHQKPERLAFYLEDSSGKIYLSKSRRIRGILGPADLGKMGVVPIATDGETTRPGTPRPGIEDATRKTAEEILLQARE